MSYPLKLLFDFLRNNTLSINDADLVDITLLGDFKNDILKLWG